MRISQALAVAILLWAGAASAQSNTGCAKMKDAVGCACAVATGGTVTGRAWARGPDKAAFDACLSAQGASTTSAGPYRIPARH